MFCKKYEGKDVEECLNKAVEEFKVSKENLSYKILEKKGLFKRKVVVEIKAENNKENLQVANHNNLKNINEENINGTIEVKDEKIIVNNPKEGGNPAIIIPGPEVKILMNGVEIGGKAEVYEKDHIKILFEEEEAQRYLDIKKEENNMQAYISIKYVPKKIFKLKNLEKSNKCVVEAEVKKLIYPPKYTLEEIQKQLSKNEIVYGLINKNIEQAIKENCNKLLIAEGKTKIDDEDDKLKLYYIKDRNNSKVDYNDKVDFKDMNTIATVSKGETIGEKIPGKEGQNGVDISSKIIKKKTGKRIKLAALNGCKIKDKNFVIATIDGKPSAKGNRFSVVPVYELNSDVDIKSGNIKFTGEVVVRGNIKEDMKVHGTSGVTVSGSVISSDICSEGNINIGGNIICSNIQAGGKDVLRIKEIEYLSKLNDNINDLIVAATQVKKMGLMGKQITDGELIKILIENKFKNIPKLYMGLLNTLLKLGEDENNELLNEINHKFIGLGPATIETYNELRDINKLIEKQINQAEILTAAPVDVNIKYCQDSKIESTGNIYIDGKGEYISEIYSDDSVYFKGTDILARGGKIKAQNRIECGTVGSLGGVTTRLEVDKKGEIFVKQAYQNTIFSIGGKEYLLDVPSREIHAYLDSKGELIVDKLLL